MLKTVTNIIDASQIKTPITLPGDVTLSTGNLVIGTSGKGIDFSATPGTGTSELLADYEEGTWTPVLSFGGGSTGLTYFLQTASYTKIGNRVYVTGRVYINAVGSSTGAAVISGLPFTVAGSTNYDFDTLVPVSLWQQAWVGTIPQARLDGNTTNLSLWEDVTGGANALTHANIQTFTSLSFSAQYVAA